MEGVGKPDLIIRPGASPHSYSLRPSEAEALSRADVVFWVSPELTPWLESSLMNLAGPANKVELLEIPGTTVHDFREGATFEAHEHHDDEHEQQHSPDEKHDGEHGEDDHADEHHHGEHDPHAWLDPENAKIWLQAISSTLSEVDAANAPTYQRNTASAIADLDALITSIRAQTKNLQGIKFIVFHDAYQYFERRFGVPAAGAISLGDARDPSPARVKEIRDTVSELGIRCVFTEPQYNPEMVRTVFESTQVTTIGVMDPLGADIETGKDHYPKLLKALVSSLNQCQE
jgi:zinc transport system substrate-binding protein